MDSGDAGRKRWEGISKEERLAHVRKMLEARERKLIVCPACGHEFKKARTANRPAIESAAAEVEVEKPAIAKPSVQALKPKGAVQATEPFKCPRHRVFDPGCDLCKLVRDGG